MIETAVEAPGEAQAKQLKNHRLSITSVPNLNYPTLFFIFLTCTLSLFEYPVF
jgi:hypothetical protein